MHLRKNFLLAGALAAFMLQGCSTSQKAAAADESCNRMQAGTAMMRLANMPASAVAGDKLPRAYTVWKATGEKAFFEAAKRESGTAALMLPSGCKTFRVSLSETMSPELAQRYPNLISLKGNSADGADLRLDWDGAQMRGQVLADGKSYLIEPGKSSEGSVAYLLFDKADATTPRQPFERSRPPRNGTTQPILEQRRAEPTPTR